MKIMLANRIASDGTSHLRRYIWGYSVCLCPNKGRQAYTGYLTSLSYSREAVLNLIVCNQSICIFFERRDFVVIETVPCHCLSFIFQLLCNIKLWVPILIYQCNMSFLHVSLLFVLDPSYGKTAWTPQHNSQIHQGKQSARTAADR